MEAIYIALGAVVFLLALAVFMTAPRLPRGSARRFGGRLFAHRGLYAKGNAYPCENSAGAFAAAAARGLPVELDVRLTADGKVVVFHDDSLKRLCGEDIKVRELTYDELCLRRLPDGQRIPLFSEVLDILGGLDVLCELKVAAGEGHAQLCRAVCEHIDAYTGAVCVESFNPYVLRWFRKNRPDIVRGQLSMRMKKGSALSGFRRFVLTNLLLNFFTRPDFIAYEKNSRSFGFWLCRLWRPLLMVWTLDRPEELVKAKKRFDSWIFEHFDHET